MVLIIGGKNVKYVQYIDEKRKYLQYIDEQEKYVFYAINNNNNKVSEI